MTEPDLRHCLPYWLFWFFSLPYLPYPWTRSPLVLSPCCHHQPLLQLFFFLEDSRHPASWKTKWPNVHCPIQGQARGYGRITQFCPLPFWGHYSHVVTVANSMDRIFKHKVPNESNHRRGSASGRLTNGGGRGSRDMIFPLTPQNPILVEWFSHSGWSNLGGFRRFSENGQFHPTVKKVFLITFFQNALIYRWFT